MCAVLFILQYVCVDLCSPPADTDFWSGCRSAAAMSPPKSSRPAWTLQLLVSAAVMIMMASLPASAVQSETCFSRQHKSVIINVRLALNRTTTVMDARGVRSERDCVLACCSEEVKPGETTEQFQWTNSGEKTMQHSLWEVRWSFCWDWEELYHSVYKNRNKYIKWKIWAVLHGDACKAL